MWTLNMVDPVADPSDDTQAFWVGLFYTLNLLVSPYV